MARGVPVGKQRVQMLMQLHGIRAKGKRRFKVTTDSNHQLPISPNLLNREFTVADKVWVGNITPRMKAGCFWPWSSTCSAARWWVGRCGAT